MRRYETIFIVRPDLPADEVTALVERFKSIITSFKGKVVKVQPWGKRRLAYTIEKKREGLYILIDFVSHFSAVAEMERNFRIDEHVLRYQSVKTSDSVDMEEIEREIARMQPEEVKPEPRASAEDQGGAAEKAPVPVKEPSGEEKAGGSESGQKETTGDDRQ